MDIAGGWRATYDPRLMRWLADLVYALVGLLYLPVALYQAVFKGKNRRGWSERLGAVRRFDPNRRRIWIHAVSLGETNATPRLVEALQRELPDWEIVLSSTTDTGYARAVQLYGRGRVFRFPLDFSLVVDRVLRRVRPTLIVLVELEVWFNLTRQARQSGIPVAVVNGRLTARSARRLARLGPASRSMFHSLAWVGAQDEAIAERFVSLGTPRGQVTVTSSMKWDTAEVADDVEGSKELAAALGLTEADSLWVCGSTGPGEEERILGAYRALLDEWVGLAHNVPDSLGGSAAPSRPLLVLVPRKPERFDEVERLIAGAGFRCLRRSACLAGRSADPKPARGVILGDTMGELRKFYALAAVVFVGRSLVPMGGSDPMEVAALGKPIIVGPHTDNFALPVAALLAAEALRQVPDADRLLEAVKEFLMDREEAVLWGARARAAVLEQQGATERTVSRLVRLVKDAGA